MSDYLPTKQADLLARMVSDTTLLKNNPLQFGITAAEAATFDAVVQDYQAKMEVVSNPATKTKAAVQAKNESKLMMLFTVRPLLQYIKGNAGVADSDKVALGLNVNGHPRTDVPAPSTVPVLNVIGALPLQHSIGYADIATPTKRGKPADVTGMELFCQIGDTPAVSVDNAKFVGTITKQPHVMAFGDGDVGKTAHYWGRWANRKGQPGGFSQVVSKTISL